MNENIPPNETCACCGTDLAWWLNHIRRGRPTKAYLYKPTDEFFCSHACMNKHFLVRRGDYEIIN